MKEFSKEYLPWRIITINRHGHRNGRSWQNRSGSHRVNVDPPKAYWLSGEESRSYQQIFIKNALKIRIVPVTYVIT